MTLALDALPDDPDLLKAIIMEQRAESARMGASVRAYETLVQALKVRIARLQRQRFGASSEKMEREIEQLELALEDWSVGDKPPVRHPAEPAESPCRSRRVHAPRRHPPPVEPLEQRLELRGRQPHHAVAHLWPDEAPVSSRL